MFLVNGKKENVSYLTSTWLYNFWVLFLVAEEEQFAFLFTVPRNTFFKFLFFGVCRQRTEVEVKDSIAARKVQKADREKLRRDRLNEHFLELGNTLGNGPWRNYTLNCDLLWEALCLN